MMLLPPALLSLQLKQIRNVATRTLTTHTPNRYTLTYTTPKNPADNCQQRWLPLPTDLNRRLHLCVCLCVCRVNAVAPPTALSTSSCTSSPPVYLGAAKSSRTKNAIKICKLAAAALPALCRRGRGSGVRDDGSAAATPIEQTDEIFQCL